MVFYEIIGGIVMLGLILVGLHTVIGFIERKSRKGRKS